MAWYKKSCEQILQRIILFLGSAWGFLHLPAFGYASWAFRPEPQIKQTSPVYLHSIFGPNVPRLGLTLLGIMVQMTKIRASRCRFANVYFRLAVLFHIEPQAIRVPPLISFSIFLMVQSVFSWWL